MTQADCLRKAALGEIPVVPLELVFDYEPDFRVIKASTVTEFRFFLLFVAEDIEWRYMQMMGLKP